MKDNTTYSFYNWKAVNYQKQMFSQKGFGGYAFSLLHVDGFKADNCIIWDPSASQKRFLVDPRRTQHVEIEDAVTDGNGARLVDYYNIDEKSFASGEIVYLPKFKLGNWASLNCPISNAFVNYKSVSVNTESAFQALDASQRKSPGPLNWLLLPVGSYSCNATDLRRFGVIKDYSLFEGANRSRTRIILTKDETGLMTVHIYNPGYSWESGKAISRTFYCKLDGVYTPALNSLSWVEQ